MLEQILHNLRTQTFIETTDPLDTLNVIIPMIEVNGGVSDTKAYEDAALRFSINTLAAFFERDGVEKSLHMSASGFFHMIADMFYLDDGRQVALSDFMTEELRQSILREVAIFVENTRLSYGMRDDEVTCSIC